MVAFVHHLKPVHVLMDGLEANVIQVIINFVFKSSIYVLIQIENITCIASQNAWIVLISAVCSPSCQNGGTCVKPGVCTCQSGWTASSCTTRTFIRFD